MGSRDPRTRGEDRSSQALPTIPSSLCPRWNLYSQGRCQDQAELVKKKLFATPAPRSKPVPSNHSLAGYKILGNQSFFVSAFFCLLALVAVEKFALNLIAILLYTNPSFLVALEIFLLIFDVLQCVWE